MIIIDASSLARESERDSPRGKERAIPPVAGEASDFSRPPRISSNETGGEISESRGTAEELPTGSIYG